MAEADLYFLSYPNENWAGEVAEKEVALRRASRDLDLLYGSQLKGVPLDEDQGLAFPRAGSALISNRLKRATFELAVLEITGEFDATGTPSEDSSVTEFTYKVEGVYSETTKYGSRAESPQLNRIRLLMGPLLIVEASGDDWGYLNVKRG